MTDGAFDSKLEKLFAQDPSKGTEGFRERLLGQCLDIVREGDVNELNDDALDLLYAAGDAYQASADKSKPKIDR